MLIAMVILALAPLIAPAMFLLGCPPNYVSPTRAKWHGAVWVLVEAGCFGLLVWLGWHQYPTLVIGHVVGLVTTFIVCWQSLRLHWHFATLETAPAISPTPVPEQFRKLVHSLAEAYPQFSVTLKRREYELDVWVGDTHVMTIQPTQKGDVTYIFAHFGSERPDGTSWPASRTIQELAVRRASRWHSPQELVYTPEV